jgi:hypothetical protein
MSSLKQQIFSFTGITGVYIGIMALSLKDQFTFWNLVSVGIVYAVFLLSALITSTGSAGNGQSNAQRFLIATTVQMLIALFFTVITRYTMQAYFKGMVIHFMILFFVFLTIQSILLVRRVKKAN